MMWSILLSVCSAQVIHPALNLDTVKQYAGSFNVTHGSLFFYMFESRGSPCDDPVIFWLNGGPGGSSMPAIVFENGPSTIANDGSLSFNPNSWNEFANVVYIDNPVGTGFSKLSDPDQPLSYSSEAAVDFVDFVNEFYKYFPYLVDTDLHIAGESYAGEYIPVFTEALVSDGKKVKSIMLGNSQVDYAQAILGTPDIFCGNDGLDRILTEDQCSSMYDAIPACKAALKTCEEGAAAGNYDACDDANDACEALYNAPTEAYQLGFNPYDLNAKCETTGTMCYDILKSAVGYFNKSSTKMALGFSSDYNFEAITSNVINNWDNREGFSGIQHKVESLIEGGVDVLVYSGADDGMIPWRTQQYWTTNLTWSGSAEFVSSVESPEAWYVNGAQKGDVSNYESLTLLKIYNAGHMAPLDQPEAASAMAKAWVQGNLSLK